MTMAAMEQMPLMKSVVYEALRIEPPVPSQYGRAKRDFLVESHDATFRIREGEILYGFQPFATKDRKIFDRALEFVPERFVGEEGEKMLKHVLWSNGPESGRPTVHDKQCAGKDFVVLVSRLLVVELFRCYAGWETVRNGSAGGASVRPSVANIGALLTFDSAIERSLSPTILAAVKDVNSDESILKGTKLSLIGLDTNCRGFLGTIEGDISPPRGVKTAMEMQAEAGRKKRAQVLESEGERQTNINIADGKKNVVILESEAAKMDQVNRA